jgi:hypothetical protein
MYQRPKEGESVALTQAAHAGTFITSATMPRLVRAVASAARSPARRAAWRAALWMMMASG